VSDNNNSNNNNMVSRRKILSQSRDELSFELKLDEQEDDVWFTKEKLFKVWNIIVKLDLPKDIILYCCKVFFTDLKGTVSPDFCYFL
jgi:hypothetical protein